MQKWSSEYVVEVAYAKVVIEIDRWSCCRKWLLEPKLVGEDGRTKMIIGVCRWSVGSGSDQRWKMSGAIKNVGEGGGRVGVIGRNNLLNSINI